MQWGDSLERLQAVASTGETPRCLLDRPTLTMNEQVYWVAFDDITGSRQWTQAGPSPIPYQCMILWLDENLITDTDDREDFIKVLQRLDSAYLNLQFKKMKT